MMKKGFAGKMINCENPGVGWTFWFREGVNNIYFSTRPPLPGHKRSGTFGKPTSGSKSLKLDEILCIRKEIKNRNERNRRVGLRRPFTMKCLIAIYNNQEKDESRLDLVSMFLTSTFYLGSVRNRGGSFRRGRADDLGGSRPPLADCRRGLGAYLEKN